MSGQNRGFVLAVMAFLLWGVLPFYWKQLNDVPALEIIAYRILMTFAILLIYFSSKLEHLKGFLSKKTFLISFVSALFLGSNWLIYVWGVNSNRIVECSLGYYINPLVSVLFGRLFFRERFTSRQAVSIILATLSVLLLTVKYGRLPYVALGLALSFSLYSVFRKKSPLQSMDGLFVEMLILSPIVLIYLLLYGGNIFHFEHIKAALLLASGFVTATPLLFYISSIRILKLSTVGMLQYIGPSIMLLIGLFVYKETFSVVHSISFILIWIAVAVFISEIRRN
jgi:chloramphenicol-sensitive protein RarD